MGKHQNSSPSSSDRRQWQRIFGTLVQMLQSQQSQIETLANDRKFLEKYIHIQNDRWASRARLLESHISQLKKEGVKGRKIQAAKLDLMVGMKQREALCYKKQFELAETDLEDFRDCVETLSAEFSELKEKLKNHEAGKGRSGVSDSKPVENPNEEERCTTTLEGEIRKLKHSYKKLSLKKEAEVSALLAEKDFVWNQFKKMESDYTAILKSKRIEVEQANEALGKLQLNLEELQTTANEKDEIIAKLKAEQTRLELDVRMHIQEAAEANEKIEQLQLNMKELAKEKDETIVKLRSELANLEMDVIKCNNGSIGKTRFPKDSDSQRNLRNALAAASGSHPRKGSRKRISESAKDDANWKRGRVYEVSFESRASAPVHGPERCSSRQRTTTYSPIERPALFHSNFKVPKLKNSPFVVVQ